MKLRPYQEDMVSITMDTIPNQNFILLMAATGAGKTIFFCTLIQRLLEQWPQLRIAVLAHRGLLVEQARDKMKKVYPDCPIGIASASVKNKVDVDSNVTIGTIQTLVNRTEETQPFDIIFIDEVHRLPPKNKKSQYQDFLSAMFAYNPETRVIGLTATPYRLGHGYIYGAVCKPEHENWFDALSYRVGIKDMQQQGFLCEYRAKEAKNISSDLKKVKVSGDYNISELSEVMSQEHLVGAVVKAVGEHASDRKRIIVFCVTIDHAKSVRDAFRQAGYATAAIHSQQSSGQRESTLRMFEDGKIRVLINVMVLGEGFDSPAIDCVVLCRPTKSAALYVQMVGRGLRPHSDKKDVLILDLANNCQEHGDPDSPVIPIPGRSKNPVPAQKACPKCLELCAVSAKTCKACGYQWPVEVYEENGTATMQDVNFNKKPPVAPVLVTVDDYHIEDFYSKKGNRMLKVSMVHYSGLYPIKFNEFLLFDRDAHPYARRKALSTWAKLVQTTPPIDMDEALERVGELEMSIPSQIEIVEDGRWWKVHNWFPEIKEEKQIEIPF